MTRTFVATGFDKGGPDQRQGCGPDARRPDRGRHNRWLEAFDATRTGDAETVKKLVKENLHVAKRSVKDRISRFRAESLAHLQSGEDAVVEIDGQAVASYREADGRVHAVSITCTHMRCTLHWNGAERSWDCPCHGSRFSPDGGVLDGPAVRPLDQVDLSEGR